MRGRAYVRSRDARAALRLYFNAGTLCCGSYRHAGKMNEKAAEAFGCRLRCFRAAFRCPLPRCFAAPFYRCPLPRACRGVVLRQPAGAAAVLKGKDMDYITKRLIELQDIDYRDFHSRLIPGTDKELIIGVRTPALRKLAKDLLKENKEMVLKFMEELPHRYYEENNLHGAFIGLLAKSAGEALEMTDKFLPYVDNWATCDCLPPKAFKKDLGLVRKTITPWLESGHTYRVRFAIVTMLGYFLDEEFLREDLIRLAGIKSEEYYINMALAWYYSFALIKQYDDTVKLFEEGILDKWVHNKSVQKALESYRVPRERKEYLKSLKKKDR